MDGYDGQTVSAWIIWYLQMNRFQQHQGVLGTMLSEIHKTFVWPSGSTLFDHAPVLLLLLLDSSLEVQCHLGWWWWWVLFLFLDIKVSLERLYLKNGKHKWLQTWYSIPLLETIPQEGCHPIVHLHESLQERRHCWHQGECWPQSCLFNSTRFGHFDKF